MTLSAEQTRANFEQVRERIRKAATASHRSIDDIQLVAVSKRMPVAAVRTAIVAGHRCFGENTVQDAANKQQALADPSIDWHFIGHLQSNKASLVAERFNWLHTLDSLKLARRLSQSRPDDLEPLRVLLQVNVAGDPDKAGILAEQLPALTERLLGEDLSGIKLCGLMTIGVQNAGQQQRRREFSTLRSLGDACARQFGEQYFTELSMGMSDDFELAIEEGATLIRVGSTLFGPRPV